MTSSAPASRASGATTGSAAASSATASAFVGVLVADGALLAGRVTEVAERVDAGAPERYAELRAALTEGPFVDMNRLLIEPADREELPQEAAA